MFLVQTVIKSRRMKFAEHTKRMEQMRNAYRKFWSENLNGGDHLEDLYADEK